MTTQNLVSLDHYHTARTQFYGVVQLATNTNLTITFEGLGEEGVFYPPQSITLNAHAVQELKKLLATIPE